MKTEKPELSFALLSQIRLMVTLTFRNLNEKKKLLRDLQTLYFESIYSTYLQFETNFFYQFSKL
jgi:hypothetical protein